MNEQELQKKYEMADAILLDTVSDTRLPEAIALLEELGDYKNSAKMLEKCRKILSYNKGNHVLFGTYKGEPISWTVLEASGRRRMLFADRPVDNVQFHFERIAMDWAHCSLRKWLNKDFLEEAFTLQERMTILLSGLDNNHDPRWDHENGPDTKDKAYVFSLKELDEYVPEQEKRALGEWWWLRGHGNSNLSQKAVYRDGTIYDGGINTNDCIGVRPVMWVRL